MIFKLLAATLLLGGAARAAEVSHEIDVSVQQRYQRTVDGAPSARPEEYGERPNGLLFEKYRFDLDSEKYMMEIEAYNIGKNNEFLKTEGGQPGKFSWKVSWDKTPHLFSNEARTFWVHRGEGIMDFPDQLQRFWEGVDVATAGAGGAASKNFNHFSSTAGIRATTKNFFYVPLGFMVETGAMDLKFHPTHNLHVGVGAWRQTRNGTKPQPFSFGFSNALEVAAPVDHVTNEANVDVHYVEKDFQLGLGYRLSDFNNQLPNLWVDNPKRFTDRTVGTHYSNGDGGASGIMAMQPDNTAHSLKAEAGLNFLETWRLSGEAGYSWWKQKNPMLPFTQNSAMGLANSPAGCNPLLPVTSAGACTVAINPIPEGLTYTAPFVASDARNLPDPNVDLTMNVITYMAKLAGRPAEDLRVALTHDAWILENKSKRYEFDQGFALFDQTWRNGAAEPKREELREDKTNLKLDYDVTRTVSTNLGLTHKYFKRTREINKGKEYQADLGLTFRPSRELYVNVSGLAAFRRANGYDFQDVPTGVDSTGRIRFTDAPGTRRPDVADRNRHSGRVQVQYAPGEASVGLSGRITKDAYRANDKLNGDDITVRSQLYGMLSDLQESVGTDFSVPVGESLVVDGYGSVEFASRRIRSSVSNTVSGLAAHQQLPGNEWVTRVIERSHAAGVALTWLPIDKLKTIVGYDLIFTRGTVDFVDNGRGSATLIAASSLTPTRKMHQNVRTRAEYKLTSSLTLAANYLYEKFDIADYGFDNVPLRDINNGSIWLGVSDRNYYAHTASLGVNYKF